LQWIGIETLRATSKTATLATERPSFLLYFE